MSAPTDLELMLLHDGELDEPRRAEVEAWVLSNPEGSKKLAGLSLGSALVAEATLSRAPAGFDVASSVLDLLATERGGAEPADGSVGDPGAPEGEQRGRKVVDLAAHRAAKKEPSGAEERPVSEDGGRLLLPLTALAAAAAVALFVWGRSAPPEAPVAGADGPQHQPVQPLPSASLDPSGAGSTFPDQALARAPDPEEVEAPVEVGSVDFGSRLGAIYQVGGGSKGVSTTVVWVRDE